MPQNMPLTNRISQEATKQIDTNVNVSTLGNNLRQYSTSGLNYQRDAWNIVYNQVDPSEENVITNVLDAVLGGVDYIIWTPFGESSPKKFVVMSYSNTFVTGNRVISFKMEQDH